MRNIARLSAASIGAAAVAGAIIVIPAATANAADTTLTVNIGSSGALSIDAPPSGELTLTLTEYTGSIGPVTVSDTRNTINGWNATANMAAGMTNPVGPETVPATAITYLAGVALPDLPNSIAIVTPGNVLPVDLSETRTAQTAAIGIPLFSQTKTASWTPLIAAPASEFSVAGTYTGTLTHSVS